MATERFDSPTMTPPGRRASRRGLPRALGGALIALSAIAGGKRRDAGARTRQGTDRKRRAGKRRDGKQCRGGQCTCDATAASGISGLVTIGPMCPVVREDEPCPDRLFAATLVIRDAQGRQVCTVRSGEDGSFRAGLPPGRYELVPVTGNPGGLLYAASQTAIVEPNQYTDVAVSFDSGIR